jgi:hypothetical protein
MDDRRMQLELRERVELERDRERLEWLINENSYISGNYVRVALYLRYSDDWRDAIDEAMSNE